VPHSRVYGTGDFDFWWVYCGKEIDLPSIPTLSLFQCVVPLDCSPRACTVCYFLSYWVVGAGWSKWSCGRLFSDMFVIEGGRCAVVASAGCRRIDQVDQIGTIWGDNKSRIRSVY
jgi:hypothetical protein